MFDELEKKLFANIRKILSGKEEVFSDDCPLFEIEKRYQFDEKLSAVCLTLFQDKIGSKRWRSRRDDIGKSLLRNISKIRSSTNFSRFNLKDTIHLGVMMEVVVERQPVDLFLLLKEDNLYRESNHGYEFIFDEKVNVFMTEAECNYYHLKTERQKIAFALIKAGIVDFESLPIFIKENQSKIFFNQIKTVALVDYQEKLLEYSQFSGIDHMIYD